MADEGHGLGMTTTKAIEMTSEMANFETLTHATLRVDEAERGVRVAKIRLNTLVPGAPLRYGVEATRRFRAADAELVAARVAYEAAQDLPAPEN
jgi:hypothetical protein